jgi:hypothetical protein
MVGKSERWLRLALVTFSWIYILSIHQRDTALK